MATFQSSVGLITGIPIADTVDQLIAISSRPRNNLQVRTAALQQQQVAIGELTALTIGIELAATKITDSALYQQRTVTSSNSDLISASIVGDAVPGTYQFTPVRTATAHQLISHGVAGKDFALGAGSMTLRTGGFVDRGVDLDLLNGGAGVERGKIRITDRSGTSEVVDLRYALTVDDVLETINRAEKINVSAVADGDSIRLVDQTGLTAANLSVQEVGMGTTAADLGLASIDVAADEATGADLWRMFDNLAVSQLNDRNGLSFRDELPDLEITFRDGSPALQIDLDSADITSVGELLAELNAADPARLQAALSGDGDRLVLTDLTTDSGGSFTITSPLGGTLAEDLGLTTSAQGDVITGNRLMGGLKGPLLGSLSGGAGIGPLGDLNLTDRSGATATVDLSSAETLADVVKAINAAGVSITATINTARNGIELTDTSGATTSHLIVANGDATNSADKLGVAIDAAEVKVNSGTLCLQVVHEATELASLNNGKGVMAGSFLITDSAGVEKGVNLATADADTVGDVLDLINGLGFGVEARINDSGDGILLVDTVGGQGTIKVADVGTGTAAADLNLAGESTLVDLGGTPTHVIDGATTHTLTLSSDDTLEDLVEMINDLNAGVTASIFQSGSGSTPYRISIVSQTTGQSGEILLDASEFGLGFREIISAQDALLQIGSSDLPGAGILATSPDNRFASVVDGVTLTIEGTSDAPVSVNVKETDEKLISKIDLFIGAYNNLRGKIEELTYFDEQSSSTGILFGSSETLRIESSLSHLVTSPFYGVGSVRSLEELGIGVKDDGTLSLNESKLKAKFAQDPSAVQQFFTDETSGFAAKITAAIETLAGEENSLLTSRNSALEAKINANLDRIDFLNSRLDTERDRLLKHFYSMELAIAKIQSNMSAVSSISALPPMTSSSREQ